VDLETLLTSREGFGLESATALQRAKCRITDGLPLDDLLARCSPFERRCIETAIGCDVANLPTGAPPTEVVDIGPVRTGKSLMMAAFASARSQTINVSIVKAGEEPPRISLLATELDQARTLRGHLNVINERAALRGLKIGEDADSITLRHPSGLPIEVRVVAAKRGGYSLASRWSGSVVFDEAPGWHGTDKIVSLEESRDQALGRLLPGAQALYGGSPWQATGWIHDTHHDRFGKPSLDLVVIRPLTVDGVAPAAQLNPAFWTTECVERMKRTSPRAFRMNVLNQFGAATACYDYDAIEGAHRADRIDSRAGSWERPFLVIDPSGGKKDSFTWAVVRRCIPAPPVNAYSAPIIIRGDGSICHEVAKNGKIQKVDGYPPLREDFDGELRPFYLMHYIGGVEGRFWDQIPADAVVERIARVAAHVGAHRVFSDQHAFYALEPHFRAHGLKLIECPFTQQSKTFTVETFRRWLREREIVIEDHPKMRSELHSFAEVPTPHGGFSFAARGSGHDDYAILPLMAVLATTELPPSIRQQNPWEPRL
jgi:hypothetical protein